MKTILVWVLVLYMSDRYNQAGVATVDNIASEAECKRLGERATKSVERGTFICTQVRKAVQHD